MDRLDKNINRRIGQLVTKEEREIAKYYASITKELRKLLGYYYEKYESGGVLTYEEMAKYDRLKKFERDIKEVSRSLYKDVGASVEKVLSDVYKDGFYMAEWGVEQEIGKRLGYVIKPEVVEAALNNPITGLVLSDRLEKNRQSIEWEIRQVTNQGLIKGETYSTMAKNINKALDKDYVKSLRVVRTEAHRVKEQGKQDSREYAQGMGIVLSKEWLCMGDERSRETHLRLDGTKIPLEEKFVTVNGESLYPGGFGVAKEDINCRCVATQTIEDVKNNELKDGQKESYEEFLKELLA